MSGVLVEGGDVFGEICRAARALPPLPGPVRPLDLLLDGVRGWASSRPRERWQERRSADEMIPDPHAGQLQHLPLREYRPQARLVRPEHQVPGAAVRAIDSHAHLGRWLSPDQSWMVQDVPRLLAEMDECNIAGIVNPRWPLGRRTGRQPGPLRSRPSGPVRDMLPPGLAGGVCAWIRGAPRGPPARMRRGRRGGNQGVERPRPARPRSP